MSLYYSHELRALSGDKASSITFHTCEASFLCEPEFQEDIDVQSEGIHPQCECECELDGVVIWEHFPIF